MVAKVLANDCDGFVIGGRAAQSGLGASAIRVLSGARLVAVASVIALGVAFTATTPQPAFAVICDNADGGVGPNPAGDDAGDDENTSCGDRSKAGDGSGEGNSAYGERSQAGTGGGTDNTAIGGRSQAGKDGGSDNTAVGGRSQAGKGDGDQNVAIGGNAQAGIDGGDDNTAVGSESRAGTTSDSDNNTAIGRAAEAEGGNATAVGDAADADGEDSAAFGADSDAGGDRSTALGQGADAPFADSTAIGNGAATTAINQMMFGTPDETYTMPGITSDLSKSRQSGPLELVTTDADGNLASDGGETVETLEEGVAIALALSDPDLFGSQTFAIKINGGFFEGSEALGATVKGLLADDVFGGGEVLTVSGGAGFGFDQDTFGGRVSVQLGW